MKQNLTKQNISLASKLLRMEEAKAVSAKKQKLEEGTPTTALPPESNATRQMQADVAAASAKSGVPAPVGIEPKADHGETAMGTQNPMGADSPVSSADYSQQGQQDGMVRPGDQRGSGGEGPASDTEQMNSTSGVGKKSVKAEDVLALEGEKLIEAFVEFCGGLDEAVFKLLAEGVSLVEAESVIVDKKLDEGLFDKVKSGITAALGQKSKPSGGYLQHLAKRRAQAAGGASRPVFVSGGNKPPAAWSSTKKDGVDARRNK